MAPTLTTTARVRLRPPKPPPRLVEPPRTTSNGHRKQAPDVVAAAKLTLATLSASDPVSEAEGDGDLTVSGSATSVAAADTCRSASGLAGLATRRNSFSAAEIV